MLMNTPTKILNPRVALARSVYQNKEIYLIDDIFSAVDIPGEQYSQEKISSNI